MAAKGMSAGTAKTAQPVEGEARQPGPKGSPKTSLETELRAALARANEPTAEELALEVARLRDELDSAQHENIAAWSIAEARIAFGLDKHERVEALAKIAWEAYCRDVYGEYRPDTPQSWADRASPWRRIAMAILNALRTNAHLKDIGHDA